MYSEPSSWTSSLAALTIRHPIRVALPRYIWGEDGRLFHHPGVHSFEEVEGQRNSLQTELDENREREPAQSVPSHLRLRRDIDGQDHARQL